MTDFMRQNLTYKVDTHTERIEKNYNGRRLIGIHIIRKELT